MGGSISEPTADDRTDLLLVLLLAGLAVALRAPGFQMGFTPDEVANVVVGGFHDILWDGETAANPPLLRLLNLGAPDAVVPHLGRVLSLGMSVVAVVAVYALGLRHGRVAAVMSSWFLCVHPLAVLNGTTFRAYATWTGLAALHLLCMSRWEDSRRWQVGAAVSAVLLPWVHYFSVPVLLGFGLMVRSWRQFAVYVAAAGCAAPLGWFVLEHQGRRQVPVDSIESVFQQVVGLGLRPSLVLQPLVQWGWEAVTVEPFNGPGWMAMGVIALWGSQVARWRSLELAERQALGGAALLTMSVVSVGSWVLVREPVALMMTLLMAPILASCIGWPRAQWGRGLLALGSFLWLFSEIPPLATELRERSQRDSAAADLAEAWPRMVDAGRPVYLEPAWMLSSVRFHVVGEVSRVGDGPGCGSVVPCFVHEGVRVSGHEATSARDGLVVRLPEATLPLWDGCVRQPDAGAAEVWSCVDQGQDGHPQR